MKKLIALGSMALGIFFLAGCGQIQSNEVKPAVTAPTAPAVAKQSEPVVAEGIVYKNSEYGFQITLPEAYKDYKVEQLTGDDVYSIKKWQISIKTTDKGYEFNGYLEPSFTIDLTEIKKWDNIPDCKNVDWRKQTCIEKEYLLGRNDKFIFSYTPSEDRSSYGKTVLDEFIFSGKIKQNFKFSN
jgi:hypothetical protein